MDTNIDISKIKPKSKQHKEILENLSKCVENMYNQVLQNFPNLSEEKQEDVKNQIIKKLIQGESLEEIQILV